MKWPPPPPAINNDRSLTAVWLLISFTLFPQPFYFIFFYPFSLSRGTQRQFPPKYVEDTFLGYFEYFSISITFNRAKFRNDICNENWEFLAPALDPNQMLTEWKTKFLQIVDKHAPIRIKRVRSKNSPWITAGLKERMHNRDTLKIKAIKSNDPHDWANFKRMRNKVNTEIKAGKLIILQ